MIQIIRKYAFQRFIYRNLHFSQTNNLFWRKLKAITEEKRILEDTKLSQVSVEVFEHSENKVKEMKHQQLSESEEILKKMIFEEAILIYLQRYGKTRRGHVQFIEASLKKMKEYGLNRSLPTYKKILEIFPEVKMIPKTFWQTELFHYPRQQECAIDILVAMEENHVMPDEEFGQLLYKRFGLHTSPMVRYQRMLYWMPKFKNANPWPIPQDLPKEISEIARIALTRMNPEKETMVTLIEVKLNEYEKTWIAHGQSNVQKKLITYLKKSFESHNQISNDQSDRVVYVDGPYSIWVRSKQMNYYMLSTDIDQDRLQHQKMLTKNQTDDTTVHFDNWYTIFDPNTQFPVYFGNSTPIEMLPSAFTKYEDELDNRTILATCMIGNESVAGLRLWVNLVIKDNPDLNNFKIVFRLVSRPGELIKQ